MPAIINGSLPEYIAGGLRRDNKLGVFSGEAYRFFPVGSANQRISPAWLEEISAPSPWNIPFVGAEAEPPSAGKVRVVYRYEGVPNPEQFDYANAVTYNLKTVTSQEPIETHPKFEQLAKVFGYDEEEGRFNRYLANRDGLEISDSTSEEDAALEGSQKSAMWGVEDYLAVRIVLIERKILGSGSLAENDRVGKIDKPPSGSGRVKRPKIPEGGTWLFTDYDLIDRGNVVEQVREWTASGPRGWLRLIYNFANR